MPNAFSWKARRPLDLLMASLSDAMSLIDFNLFVLRDSGGHLQEYALLVPSRRLDHLLWPEQG